MKTIRNLLWVAAAVFGIAFIGIGATFVYMGYQARGEIKDRLIEQQVYTSADAEKFGVPANTLVQDAKTAQAQADVIKLHTLGRHGPFQTLAREDPNRQSYFNGAGLQAALGLSVLALGVADLAMGSGALILLIGFATLVVGVPGLYFIRVPAEEKVARAAPAIRPAHGYAGAD
ncbi:MAG: hypothetical protein FJ319_00570 [SAR202 cluster bacterium]|nr:hypothetical protein [SAR202 cluster bacterium]